MNKKLFKNLYKNECYFMLSFLMILVLYTLLFTCINISELTSFVFTFFLWVLWTVMKNRFYYIMSKTQEVNREDLKHNSFIMDIIMLLSLLIIFITINWKW